MFLNYSIFCLYLFDNPTNFPVSHIMSIRTCVFEFIFWTLTLQVTILGQLIYRSKDSVPWKYFELVSLLSPLHNFIQQTLNSSSPRIQILLVACHKFAMGSTSNRSRLKRRLKAFRRLTIPQIKLIINNFENPGYFNLSAGCNSLITKYFTKILKVLATSFQCLELNETC